jgi:Reverse transcriptase (RNA-dependent DNA polymerase)
MLDHVSGEVCDGSGICLRLLKSLYGLSVAPRLWYDCLSEALLDHGFKPSTIDPCLLVKDTMMIVLYVDNLGITYSSEKDLQRLLRHLKSRNLAFTRVGTFADFLGINFTHDMANNSVTLTRRD